MKLVVLVSRVPYPLEKGDKLRAYHQVRELSKHHEVMLCCLSAEEVHPEARAELAKICARLEIVPLQRWRILFRMAFSLVSTRPYQVHYFLQKPALAKVKSLIEDFAPDHIYCQLVRCSEYVKHLYTIPKTLDYMDAMNKGMQRLATRSPWYSAPLWRNESRRLLKYENLIFDYFDHHTIISEQDKQLIYHPRRSRIEVIPNGVDTAFFEPKGSDGEVYDVVFTGNMSYPPNIDTAVFLATEVMPEVWKQHPDARLQIAGASPHAKVKALASERVVVTGWLDDIRDAYRNAKVFAAPMRIGTGLQNKLLEAMSMQVPCVSSKLANNALGARDGREIVIGHTAREVAAHISTLLEDEQKRKELALNGRAFVLENYSWEASVKQLSELFMTKN